MGSNAERLKRYRERMAANGFKRLSFYAAPELVELIAKERQPYECGGRTLERLLLGEAKPRPEYWTAAERAQKAARRAASGRQITKV
ncbi:MAG TPA: hypothetical protein VFC74_03315 [Oscillospiraceae bacterium]|nr:hypothetical protein [Oscillospiraceae bacterium]